MLGRFRISASVVTIVVKVNKAIHLCKMRESWENWGCNNFQKPCSTKVFTQEKSFKRFFKALGFKQPWITRIDKNTSTQTR